ncbi:hypothetical protein [Streptomyces tremellae]|uniref:Secreted protein n=1 Tax=Streptomyces tremellae TaxID=1124239 RepID=A0ABP7G0M3_9ACTN
MTHLPNTAAPPAGPGPPPPPPPPPPSGAGPGGRREAWREAAVRVRRAARTEPGRLRIIGAGLALAVVVFGAVAAWQSADRFASADAVVSRGQTVKDTADLYGALADADTQAATGFLSGATEPASVQDAYRDDIARAAGLLSDVAENTEPGSRSADLIAGITEQLPVYTGLIERARAENRRGLPLGGAYLRYANDRMTRPGGILPDAEALYEEESGQLRAQSGDAQSWPYAALALGVLALAALAAAQRRNYRHTHRVFNRGLLTATAACTAAVLWLVAAQAVGGLGLDNADRHGQRSLTALNAARINALKARADESLTLVSRGSVVAADGRTDKYEVDFGAKTKTLAAELDHARALAAGTGGADPVTDAIAAVTTWQERHRRGSADGAAGRFQDAREALDGPGATSEQAFDDVNTGIATAIGYEQREFTTSARDGRGALTLVWLGAALLAALAAVSAILGVGRRLSEFR